MEPSRHYVYALAYPDGRIFYVGKGVDDRFNDHEREARAGKQSRKCDIIREIWASGEEIIKTKLAFFGMEPDALRYEASLISSLGGLANISQGRKRIRDALIASEDRQYFGKTIRHIDEDFTEYWDAREAAEFFGYVKWQAFHGVIKRAIKDVQRRGKNVSEHFVPIYKIIQVGSHKGKREIEDYRLSREAFLAITMNISPTNVIASVGHNYIAEQVVRASTLPEQLPIPKKPVSKDVP